MTESHPSDSNALLEQLADAIQADDPDQTHLREIVNRVMAQSQSWESHLRTQLIEAFGDDLGDRYARSFRSAFPSGYRTRFSVAEAVSDLRQLLSIAVSSDVPMRFYPVDERDGQVLRFKLYSQGKPVILSDVIPMLENLGMRVLDEHPYRIQRQDGETFGVSDFTVEVHSTGNQAVADSVMSLLQEAFREIWNGFAENDELNRLIMVSGLGWREVSLLRAYSRYIKQLRFGFSQPFIAETLARHVEITRRLVALFQVRFDPAFEPNGTRADESAAVEEAILADLEAVESLDDDRILRRFYLLIKATLRTNFFQRFEGQFKSYLSLKFDPQSIPDIPKPRPRFEVFVYSPRVEGVHLRAGPVARGGLRWSDRAEDYRTEILGLVKAQQVKNSVIVPVGAKGGFIVKQPPRDGSRQALQEEGVACYRIFIRGLLDLTDNLEAGQVVPPADVVRHDDDDPYLVVAADKGTATFSDIANRLAEEYGFWLGDAFASGGSEGYDHKKMGITARGAWESVKRHFLEKGVDTQSDEFTVVGVGDMGGDVFGNGMLLSDRIRLVGAFNHLHIFIDPKPDAAAAFRERQRLFEQPGSSWADYDRELISKGGGVFSRSQKSIPINAAMRKALGTDARRLTPNELISALLQAPVDMIWNGGIGTYAKSPAESHESVGDKANDPVRVDSNQLRCRVLGEGGNLGFTQLARIGFARRGGAANTDFIDNAGGVDCSDHEVNIKILLSKEVQEGRLSLEQRNRLLREMTGEVSELVLQNNYRQALALSLAESTAAASLDEHERFMRRLEAEGRLDRALEFLPGDEALQERKESLSGLTRPELSVLVSYAKIELKQLLLASPLVHDERFRDALYSAFPASLLRAFPGAVEQHPLRAEITATQLANDMVNRMGITWLDKIRHASRSGADEIAAAYRIAVDIYDVDAQWREIEALDGQIAAGVQLDLLRDLTRLVTRTTNWLLRTRPQDLDAVACRERYQPHLVRVMSATDSLRGVIPESRWNERYDYYVSNSVPERLAACCASTESRYWLMDIIEVALQFDESLEAVAWVYFSLGESLNLTWLDRQMRQFRARGHWEVLATSHYRDDLDYQLRHLTSSVFRVGNGSEQDASVGEVPSKMAPETLLAQWRDGKQTQLGRWKQMLGDMQTAKNIDCAVFSVAHGVLRELAAEAG
ncbi:NAD-glutamate dehydrogenase [Marinobacter bohaiensis]|uniref:NAD-glutamate dehydrogenase n=1 Tax=Marinobacter bohaiensis TaxID=2201898 RepID=UPI000DACB308|nr:NAD-glutamate dehydrogenase domain-containing protein [Marinobacter bohaiensis]